MLLGGHWQGSHCSGIHYKPPKEIHFSPGLLNMMRLALVMRRRETVLFSLPSRSLFASGKDLAGWKGPHENLSPTFCPSRLVNSHQITQAIVWLGPRAEVPQPPWAVVPIVLIVTSPHQARAHSHSICSLSWGHLTGKPGSVSQWPFPWVLTGSFVAHQSHCVSRLRWPCFLSLSSQGKSSSPHCLAAFLWVCATLSTFFLYCGAQSKCDPAGVRPHLKGDNCFA